MYSDAIWELFFCGFFAILMLICLLIQWSDSSWSDKFFYSTIILFLGIGFCLSLGKMNRVLTRVPVISSCIPIGDNHYEIVDSTLRCKRGLEPRYKVIKSKCKIESNEQTPCENCGKIMIEHYDISYQKTDADIENESIVDWMNAPL